MKESVDSRIPLVNNLYGNQLICGSFSREPYLVSKLLTETKEK